MELSLHRLRILREVAHTGGVSAAARTLHYSPSAISQHLAALEETVEAPLVERIGRGVRLTAVGRVLAEHAEILLQDEQRAQAAVERVRDTEAAELTIGVFSTVAAGLVPAVLADLADSHPEVRLRTRQADPDDAVADIRHGHLDLAFLLDYPDAPEPRPASLGVVDVGEDRLHLAAPAGQFPQGSVRLRDLADLDWVISGPHTHYGRAVLAACRREGFDLNIVHQVDEQATALAMVGAGLGITLLSDLARPYCPANVDIRDLTRPLKRRLLLTYHPDAAGRPAVRAVLECVTRAASGLER